MTMGRTYGYARVATDGQTLDAHVAALKGPVRKKLRAMLDQFIQDHPEFAG